MSPLRRNKSIIASGSSHVIAILLLHASAIVTAVCSVDISDQKFQDVYESAVRALCATSSPELVYIHDTSRYCIRRASNLESYTGPKDVEKLENVGSKVGKILLHGTNGLLVFSPLKS